MGLVEKLEEVRAAIVAAVDSVDVAALTADETDRVRIEFQNLRSFVQEQQSKFAGAYSEKYHDEAALRIYAGASDETKQRLTQILVIKGGILLGASAGVVGAESVPALADGA